MKLMNSGENRSRWFNEEELQCICHEVVGREGMRKKYTKEKCNGRPDARLVAEAGCESRGRRDFPCVVGIARREDVEALGGQKSMHRERRPDEEENNSFEFFSAERLF
jgi:hypothetical protein